MDHLFIAEDFTKNGPKVREKWVQSAWKTVGLNVGNGFVWFRLAFASGIY